MPSANKVFLIGRLTRDVETKFLASGKQVTSFSLAVDRKFKGRDGEKQTDFFRCKAWGKTAEFVDTHVGKGRLVAIEGRIETSESTGQDGQKKYFTDIVCEQVELLDSPKQTESGTGPDGVTETIYDDSDPFSGDY